LDTRSLEEWIVGVERRIAKVFVGPAVKAVRSTSCEYLDVAAAGAAKGSVIERGLYLEFLNGLWRWHCEACDGVIGCDAEGIHAVDLEIVLRRARAVDRGILRVEAYGRVVRQIDERARRESQNLSKVARRQRQF